MSVQSSFGVFWVCISLSLAACGPGTNRGPSGGTHGALVDGQSELAFDLARRLETPSQNFCFSPLSVSTALGLAWAGARGSTETQLATAMHNSLSQDAYHPAAAQLLQTIQSRAVAPVTDGNGEKSVVLTAANGLWLKTGLAAEPGYLDVLSRDYDAGVQAVDFAADGAAASKTINDWVSAQTHGAIDRIFDEPLPASTTFVLANTLYFKGSWASAFHARATQPAAFHGPAGDVVAPQMSGAFDASFAEGSGWQAVDLPYVGNHLVMTLVLPAEGRFDEIRGSINAAWLDRMDAAASTQFIGVKLPRFRFSWGGQLEVTLRAMGAVDAFDAQRADFTGLSSGARIALGDVFHRAVIGVDESGTEAAAVTALVGYGSAPRTPRPFVADRPFLFFIRDRETGTLLFLGQVVDPTQT